MARRHVDLAKTVDHTLLEPDPTGEAVSRLCDEAREHHFAAVCVLPEAVPLAAESLRGCDVKVAAIVGFPLGAGAVGAKVAEAERCVAAGADELDLVLDVGALLAGDVLRVRDELAAVVRAARLRSMNTGRGRTLVKVVLECDRLGDRRSHLACRIVESARADFVSTSAAAGRSVAEVLHDIELVRDWLPDSISVKAAGEIASATEAADVLTAGAVRLGTKRAVAVVGGRELQGAGA